ncbi:MAG: tRNA pseudouridine(13) synthase TruD [Candidatus Bathyarchaeales archaeon]
MFVPKIEKMIGIEVYATNSPGIGGTIRNFAEDFIVEEILVNGSKAGLQPQESQVSGFPTIMEPYLLCVLIKRNKDTFIALKAMAQQLGISADNVHIAGIKDAKAITAQHITLKGVSAEEVKKVFVKDVEIYPISFFHRPISSYYLLGNNFQVVIREIRHSKSTINERVIKIVKDIEDVGGVPNFFGHQRFGTTRPITHLVGKALIQGDFKKAAMLFLAKSTPHEHPESRQARKQLWKTQDFKQALKDFPKKLYYERLMLKHLTKKSNDFMGAFRRLPKKLLILFPQAYQSYLFNRFLSKRIGLGLPLNKAEVGDYVVKLDSSGLPITQACMVTSHETLPHINAEIETGRMRGAIPLLGFRQKLSQGIQGEIEKQILDKEGVLPGNFKVKGMPELSLKGGIRTTLTPLNDFSLNKILRDDANPSKWKSQVSFMLHRGSYATVFLREIMKTRNPIKSGF